VEGLETDGVLDPVQEGFMRCHGLQCGFCTPGMLMALQAALDAGVTERHALARAISGNLCRCGAYENILDAAVDVCAAR
jgi:carbon-monoxide dehydrogenase small subunit